MLILGGSNSGVNTGWASELTKTCKGHEFDNRFLGAVSSLFGLLRLLKMRNEGEPAPELVIFEYTLNDSAWLASGNISPQIICDALHDVATICAQNGSALAFLCLSVKPPLGQQKSEGSRFTDSLYRQVARERGAYCLILDEIIGEISGEDYADELHLTSDASRRVAQAVCARIDTFTRAPRGGRRPLLFEYLDVSTAQVPRSPQYHQSAVFSGFFVELARGQSLRWRNRGRLVALMLRTTEKSGFYLIREGRAVLRKNANSAARETMPALMTLHHLTQPQGGGADIVVESPIDAGDLETAPHDFTIMESEPTEPFASQTIEINGIVVYRARGFIRIQIERVFGFFYKFVDRQAKPPTYAELHSPDREDGRASKGSSLDGARDCRD